MATNYRDYHPINANNQCYSQNPQSVYKWLRENAPVTWHHEYNGWIVVKAVDYELTKDYDTFSKAGLSTSLQNFSNNQAILDKYEHGLAYFNNLLQLISEKGKRLNIRKFLSPFYSSRTILSKVSKPVIEEACEIMFSELMLRAKNNKQIDWELEFTIPFTGIIINRTLGLSSEDCLKYYHASISILDIFTIIKSEKELQTKIESFEEFIKLYTSIIDQKRNNLIKGEVLSELIKLRDNGTISTDDELLSHIVLLISNSYLAIVGVLGNILEVFNNNQDAVNEIRSDLGLLPNAIQEAIRLEGLGLFEVRVAKRNITLRTKEIKAGQQVYFFNVSANWDEEIFTDPHVFNIRRDLSKNYSFGVQNTITTCIAVNYVQLLCETVFSNLLSQFSNFKIVYKSQRKGSYIFKYRKKMFLKLKI